MPNHTDRELDAMVAMEFFGFEYDDIHPAKVFTQDQANAVGVPCSWRPLPRYSTDIESAWEVVEKMSESKFGFLLEKGEWNWNESNKNVFNAGFGLRISPVECESYKVDKQISAPRAICIAALKSRGVSFE